MFTKNFKPGKTYNSNVQKGLAGMTKTYTVVFSMDAVKTLAKIEEAQKIFVTAWIKDKLTGCDNPRRYGRGVSGEPSGGWKYRVGDYQVLARIVDVDNLIYILDVNYRCKI